MRINLTTLKKFETIIAKTEEYKKACATEEKRADFVIQLMVAVGIPQGEAEK